MPKRSKKRKPKGTPENSTKEMQRELSRHRQLRNAALMLAEDLQKNNPKIKPLIAEMNRCRKEVAEIRRKVVSLQANSKQIGDKLTKALQPYIPEKFRDPVEEE